MITVTSVQRIIADISIDEGVLELDQAPTQYNEVDSVTAFAPSTTPGIVRVLSRVTMELSEYINPSEAIVVDKELVVEISAVLDMLNWRGPEIGIAVDSASCNIHVTNENDMIALLLEPLRFFEHVLVEAELVIMAGPFYHACRRTSVGIARAIDPIAVDDGKIVRHFGD